MRFSAAAVVAVSFAFCAAAQNPCELNFRDSGSVFRGKHFTTRSEFADIEPGELFGVLSRSLAADKSLKVISRDARSQTIVVESALVPGAAAPADRTYPITFKVQPGPLGANVVMHISLQTGMFASPPEAKSMMCSTMKSLARDLERMEPDRSVRSKSLHPRMKRRA